MTIQLYYREAILSSSSHKPIPFLIPSLHPNSYPIREACAQAALALALANTR